jgi:hypothetical protein
MIKITVSKDDGQQDSGNSKPAWEMTRDRDGRSGCRSLGSSNSPSSLEHVPEKHALELDPMGGNRFSERDMRQ